MEQWSVSDLHDYIRSIWEVARYSGVPSYIVEKDVEEAKRLIPTAKLREAERNKIELQREEQLRAEMWNMPDA